MQNYHTFTTQDVADYLQQHTFHTLGRSLDVAEIGDGNLNLVFRVKDLHSKQSLIVKQALPYARCVGESWPLTLDRARIEAQALQIHGEYCPEYTTKVYHADSTMALTVMEDLSDHTILRAALIQQQVFPHFAQHAGTYLARTLFFTSDFYMDQQQKKWQVAQFINPELCKITEDLFFSDPYQQHERNRYNPLLEDKVLDLQQNMAVKVNVARLKEKFLTQAQALLHGDVHTGSIFVTANSTKFIDPEFAFYGPIAFDVGSLLANIMLNYCAQSGLSGDQSATEKYQLYLKNLVLDIWNTFASTFQTLMSTQTRDPNFAVPAYQSAYLAQILKDSAGFAGTELIRRTIGLAHVKDLDSIEDAALRAQCESKAIDLGKTLILNYENINAIRQITDAL